MIGALDVNHGDVEMLGQLMVVLERLAQNPESARMITTGGGAQKALALLAGYPGEPDVVMPACMLLRALAAHDQCRAVVASLEGGRQQLSQLYQECYQESAEMCPRASMLAQYAAMVSAACFGAAC